jgi:hypothetical protein
MKYVSSNLNKMAWEVKTADKCTVEQTTGGGYG